MRLNTLAGLGLALLGLACAGCEKKPDNVLTIAYAPNESTEQSVDARNGMAAELGKALGMEVKEIHTSDYTAIIEALRTGQADMAYIGSFAVGMAMKRAKATPVVMKAPEGDRAKAIYHSVIVVRADNAAINSIRDLKGRTMAFVDPDSTSGNLLPTADIIKAFPELHLNSDHLHANGDFFEAVSYSGKHQAGLQAVLKGDIDAAPCSDNILAFEISRGAVPQGALKVIHTSAPIPAEAFVVGRKVPAETRAKIQAFLQAYDDEAYFAQLLKVPGARFVPCTEADYQPILDLCLSLNGE